MFTSLQKIIYRKRIKEFAEWRQKMQETAERIIHENNKGRRIGKFRT